MTSPKTPSLESKSVGESVKIYEMSFYNQPPEFFVRYKDIAHLLNPTPKPDGAGERSKMTTKISHARAQMEGSKGELTRKDSERLAVLSKRIEFLRSRIVDAEASGRDLSFDKQEMSALTWAVDRLTAKPDEGS